jgi:hypothetical protein
LKPSWHVQSFSFRVSQLRSISHPKTHTHCFNKSTANISNLTGEHKRLVSAQGNFFNDIVLLKDHNSRNGLVVAVSQPKLAASAITTHEEVPIGWRIVSVQIANNELVTMPRVF